MATSEPSRSTAAIDTQALIEVVNTENTIRSSEVMFRIGWRDAQVYVAITMAGLLYQGKISLVAPILLLVAGSIWAHHDERAGLASHYTTVILTPIMKDLSIEHFNVWLKKLKTTLTSAQTVSFNAAIMRGFWPTLQLLSTVAGAIQAHNAHVHWVLIYLAVAFNINVTAITFLFVKRWRLNPDEERSVTVSGTATTP